ncbi:MAG: hypothetical protein F6K40_31725 [Okeania sp. SIO3I5]|uniref:hypothetical protein n=1 Tax=Okeania sp. SIO3I5 TaxID=2607805 RepID=UPI0013B75E5A|nr:hypothetical protein [Okeania sp. SIO3I5]NEQ40554.1 hypothetical protein [Okeania sp. SIO3I5]
MWEVWGGWEVWEVGGIIVLVSFWKVSATRPNFLVLKAKKFALFSLYKCLKP